MFHLAPVGISPVYRPDRSQVIQLEEDLHKAVPALIEAKSKNKCLDINEPAAKNYLKVLDIIFSHGLLKGDRCYWRFVREFIPKCEREVIYHEWNAKTNRALSISWLKDSLNKESLYFQILGINSQEQKVVERFYHKNACIYSENVRLRIADEVCKVTFSLSFRMPNIERLQDEPEAIPLAEDDLSNVASPSTARLNPRRLRREERLRNQAAAVAVEGASASIHDLTRDLTEAALTDAVHAPYLSTTKDHEYLIDAMINRHNTRTAAKEVNHNEMVENAKPSRFHSDSFSSQPSIAEDGHDHTETQMDEVLRKTISKVKLEQDFDGDDCLPRSFDSFVFPDIKFNREQPKEADDYDEVDGEILLESGETVEMAMKVFLEETEGFQKLFLVYSGHGAGTPVTRQLLLTDRNIYLISETNVGIEDGSEALPGLSTNFNSTQEPSRHSIDYIVHAVIPLTSIDCITAGVDHQILSLQANERRFQLQSSHRNSSSKHIAVDTASERLGRAIVHFVVKAIESCGLRPPIVDKGPTQQSIVLRRFVLKELGLPHVEIAYHGLAYWFQSGWKKSVEQCSEMKDEFAGFLYHRSFTQSSWRKPTSEWNLHYFVIQGHQLFKFTDSNCKLCEEKIMLNSNCTVSEIDLKKDEQFVIQLETSESSSNVIQFSCASREDMKRWMQKFSLAISKPDIVEAPSACSLTLTDNAVLAAQEGDNCIVDGFMRSLVMIPLQSILQVIGIRIGSHRGILIHSEKDNLEWFLVRSDNELNRLQAAFEQKLKMRLVNYSDRDSIGRKLSDFISCEESKLPSELWHPDY